MKSAFCTASQYGYSRKPALIVIKNVAAAATTATTATADSHRHTQGRAAESRATFGVDAVACVVGCVAAT